MTWQIRLESDDTVIRSLLETDSAWAVYLLADLEPPFRTDAHFYLAARDGVDRAVLLIYAPAEFSVIASLGDPDGLRALLAGVDQLPEQPSLSIPREHRAIFEERYASADWHTMYRMILSTGFKPPQVLQRHPQRLWPVDLAAIERLLATRADRDFFFTPTMLTSGVYHGIFEEEQLVAMAGTHVTARVSRVAAIGNVYTRPDARRRGHARATTAAVTQTLLTEGYRQIALNVAVDNAGAIAIYEQLGFYRHRVYVETPMATLQSQ